MAKIILLFSFLAKIILFNFHVLNQTAWIFWIIYVFVNVFQLSIWIHVNCKLKLASLSFGQTARNHFVGLFILVLKSMCVCVGIERDFQYDFSLWLLIAKPKVLLSFLDKLNVFTNKSKCLVVFFYNNFVSKNFLSKFFCHF